MEFLYCIFILFIDYLITSFGVWIIISILNVLGMAITFTWYLSLCIWIIIKIIKLIF